MDGIWVIVTVTISTTVDGCSVTSIGRTSVSVTVTGEGVAVVVAVVISMSVIVVSSSDAVLGVDEGEGANGGREDVEFEGEANGGTSEAEMDVASWTVIGGVAIIPGGGGGTLGVSSKGVGVVLEDDGVISIGGVDGASNADAGKGEGPSTCGEVATAACEVVKDSRPDVVESWMTSEVGPKS